MSLGEGAATPGWDVCQVSPIRAEAGTTVLTMRRLCMRPACAGRAAVLVVVDTQELTFTIRDLGELDGPGWMVLCDTHFDRMRAPGGWTLVDERTDLEAAIARLRQGIGRLNREGRERLLAAFETIDGHFRAIFTRLFGGGNARLALTEAEGDNTEAMRILLEDVCNRSEDGDAPLDLPERTQEIIRNHQWMAS